MESPESWFKDVSSGQFSGGSSRLLADGRYIAAR
jgi:hypothetical protein